MRFHSTNSWRACSPTLSLSVSVCLSVLFLSARVSFLPRLCEIDCAPLPSADAAVRNPPSFGRTRSLSPSLTPIGCLVEVTSPFFSA